MKFETLLQALNTGLIKFYASSKDMTDSVSSKMIDIGNVVGGKQSQIEVNGKKINLNDPMMYKYHYNFILSSWKQNKEKFNEMLMFAKEMRNEKDTVRNINVKLYFGVISLEEAKRDMANYVKALKLEYQKNALSQPTSALYNLKTRISRFKDSDSLLTSNRFTIPSDGVNVVNT